MTHDVAAFAHDADSQHRTFIRNASNTEWTDELCEAVQRLWLTHTAARIAEILNERGYNFTMAAVIGKIRRLGLLKPRQEAPAKSVLPDPPPSIEPRHISFAALENGDCRFAFGDDPQSMTFCGLPQCIRIVAGEEKKSSYCGFHHQQCCRPANAPKNAGAVKLGDHRGGVFGRGR